MSAIEDLYTILAQAGPGPVEGRGGHKAEPWHPDAGTAEAERTASG